MSATHKNTVNALLEGTQNMMGRDASRAHYPDNANVRRVLHTTDPSQVSSGIRSPGAEKAQNGGLKISIIHRTVSLFSISCSKMVSQTGCFPV